MPPLPSEGSAFVITYGTISPLAAFCATIHMTAGVADAVWSTIAGGTTKRTNHPITQEFFRTLWSAMDSLPEFRDGWTTAPEKDPVRGFHYFRAMIVDKDNPKEILFERRHVIPTKNASELLRDLLYQAGMGHLK
ncbi:MAG: hypothetical protein JNJ83_00890 [Verrucomicrobiaceae bacterium]|nr:hypothetical protein [Verrucomicrobiaceae bacterium]